jgi:hypothetical protein
MTHTAKSAESSDLPNASDEEYSLPCAEALLAGTLALMTGYVLGQSDVFTPHFRTMLCNLQNRWVQQCGAGRAEPVAAALSAAEQRRVLWVPAPEVVQ